MTRRAFLFPLEAQAQRVIMVEWGKRAPLRANIFMARDVFFHDVLRIELSDLHEVAREHTRGTKESFTRSS